MASNKNQHFVPRCYLRPFTLDGLRSPAINLYNIDRRCFIEKAALKHQCSGDYFYGKDEHLERIIRMVETQYASTLRSILSPGYALENDHRVELRRFWLLQHLRTEAASRRSAEMVSVMTTSPGGHQDPRFRLEIKEAIRMAMLMFAEEIGIVDDLKVCLVRNRSSVPFFTSDDPAILTNRLYLESSKPLISSFGLKSAGDILLLPLSPKVLLLAYDGDVYSVPNERGWVEVRDERDIQAFNDHQLINCRANIFVQSAEHSAFVHEAFKRVELCRPKERYTFHYAVLDEVQDDYKRYRVVSPAEAEARGEALVHAVGVPPKPLFWPRLPKWRMNGCAYENGTGIGYVRESETHVRRGPPFRRVRTPF